MKIIRQALAFPPAQLHPVRLAVERLTLAKRRWRGVAEDGAEFGFDLELPIADGAAFHLTDNAVYLIAQKYEPVLELQIGSDAARVGWLIGNLHFQIEVLEDVVRVVDDSAVRQMFEREAIPFTPCKRVFHPIGGGHSHGHSH